MVDKKACLNCIIAARLCPLNFPKVGRIPGRHIARQHECSYQRDESSCLVVHHAYSKRCREIISVSLRPSSYSYHASEGKNKGVNYVTLFAESISGRASASGVMTILSDHATEQPVGAFMHPEEDPYGVHILHKKALSATRAALNRITVVSEVDRAGEPMNQASNTNQSPPTSPPYTYYKWDVRCT